MPHHTTPAYQSDDECDDSTEGPRELLRSTRDLRADISNTASEIATQRYILELENKIQALTKQSKEKKKPERNVAKGDHENFTALSKQFVLTVSLWLHDQQHAFSVKEDPSFKPSIQYQSHYMTMQGQIRDLKAFVPESLHAKLSDKDFQIKFIAGMQDQRAVAISCIREGLSKIFKDLNIDIDNPEERRRLNGWSQKEDGSGSYHWVAPILYENFDYNKDYPGRMRLFHNMAIVQAYYLLFYGVSGLSELKTVRKGTYGGWNPIGIMWKLGKATPTTLAVVTTLLRCALTDDKCLNPTAKSSSGIGYHDFFDKYMMFCGKRSKQKDLESTLEWVNQTLYPQNQRTVANTDSDTEETRKVLGEPSSDHEDDENSREMRDMNENEDEHFDAQTDRFASPDGISQDIARVSRPHPRMVSNHGNESMSSQASATPQASVAPSHASAPSVTVQASITPQTTPPAFTVPQVLATSLASTTPQDSAMTHAPDIAQASIMPHGSAPFATVQASVTPQMFITPPAFAAPQNLTSPAPAAPQDSVETHASDTAQVSIAPGPSAISVYVGNQDALQNHARQKHNSGTADIENSTRQLRSRTNVDGNAPRSAKIPRQRKKRKE